MKNLIFLLPTLGTCLVPHFNASAQYYYYNSRFYESDLSWQIGASISGMNCLTDLGGQDTRRRHLFTDVNWKNTRPSVTMYGSGLYKNIIGLRFQITMGQVMAFDSILKSNHKTYGRYNRNLSFRSTITEVVLLTEFYPFQFKQTALENLLSPYFLTGLGFFNFNPVAKSGNNWINLKPLHTEGQGFTEYPGRKDYRLNQWNLPFGAGFNFHASSVVHIAFEFVYRKLFTDYLDDVSTSYIDPSDFNANLSLSMSKLAIQMANRQKNAGTNVPTGELRGNPDNNDAYFSFNFKIGVVVGKK